MCEEVLLDQVKTVQGEHSASTSRDNAVGRIKTCEVSMETQGIGVQVSQTQREIGSVRRREISNAGQIEVPVYVWK